MATGARPRLGIPLSIERLPGLEPIIAKCLQPDPGRRYQHASDVRVDLQRLIADTGADVTRHRADTSPGRRRVILSAAAVAMTIAAGAGYVAYESRHAPALGPSDTIVLGSFLNSTGDPVFDDTV